MTSRVVTGASSSTTHFSVSRTDLRTRLLTRLLERHDQALACRKPLSLLRAEVLQAADQFLATEAVGLSPAQRQELLAEVFDELPSFSPLEELFQDVTVSEIMILAHNQVIRRQGESWLPTSVQFRDRDHLRRAIKQLFRTAEPIGNATTTSDGAADAMLPNGFRMIAIIPPRVMELPCTAVFRRESDPPACADSATNLGSAAQPIDHWEALRIRVCERIAERLAANGVQDLLDIPQKDLQRVLAAYVHEFNELDQLGLDSAGQTHLTITILNHLKLQAD